VRDGLPDAVKAKADAEAAAKKQEKPGLPSSKDAVLGELPLDPLELAIGFGLVPTRRSQGRRHACRPRFGDPPPDRRRARDRDPAVRIHDEIGLDSHEYVVKVRGSRSRAGALIAGHHLAMDPGDAVGSCQGIPTTEPAFGLPATWIADGRAPRPRRSATPSSTASR
jgi:flagellar biosynthesis protein FlhA